MVLQYLNSFQPPYGEILLTVAGLLSVWLSYKIGKVSSSIKHGRSLKKLKEDNLMVQRSLAESWESSKETLEKEIKNLKSERINSESKLNEYRSKLSGTGFFSTSSSKKKSELTEILLVENELLEQIIFLSRDKGRDVSKLVDKLEDLNKKQLLLSDIFKDEKLKNYVRDLIEDYLKKGK